MTPITEVSYFLPKITPLVLGGKDSPLYDKFVKRWVTYLFYLRKNSKLILNLLYLAIDSGLIINPNKDKVHPIMHLKHRN